MRGVIEWAASLDIDALDVALALGLVLLGVGCALVWLPAAFIVPGAVLVYIGARTYGRIDSSR